jgi:hypothetical protein
MLIFFEPNGLGFLAILIPAIHYIFFWVALFQFMPFLIKTSGSKKQFQATKKKDAVPVGGRE